MENKNKTVWSNRFNKPSSKIFQRIGASIHIDKRLYSEDIFASIIHTHMLIKQKIAKIYKKKTIFFNQNTLKIPQFPQKNPLISSKELSPNELDEISKDLSESMSSKIKLDYKVDKELIGGLKLQLGSFMIDTSIKNRLKKYKQAMLEN